MTERETQCRQILRYMEDVGPITQMIATREFECIRLPSRIFDLREAGYPVQDDWEYKLNESGKVVKKWKKYFLPRQ